METIVCKENFFEDRPDRAGLGNKLVSFSSDIRYWYKNINQGECREFLDFLNGGSRKASLRLRFIIPDSALEKYSTDFRSKMQNADSFLDYVFRGYGILGTAAGTLCYPMWVQVDQNSVNLLKVYRGHRQDVGGYLKYEVCISAQYQLTKPVEDLSYEEIANHYQYGFFLYNRDKYCKCKAIKAILQNPGRIFCSGKEHFISWLPQSAEEAEKIFLEEFRRYRILEYGELADYGRDFSPYVEGRKVLGDPSAKVTIRKSGAKRFCWETFGKSPDDGCCVINVRIPDVDRNPGLFVKNTRKGIQFMKEYVESCRETETIALADFRIGCFHYIAASNQPLLLRASSAHMDNPQAPWDEIRQLAIAFTNRCIRNFSAVSDFTEFLMGKGDCTCNINQRLAIHVMDCVKLDPLQFTDYEDGAVSRLARFYVNGEY